jgi:deoxyribose-phosphate aldolase
MAEDHAALARRLIACLDLTELKDGCTQADVDRLLARAATPAGPVAAVCIWPQFVARAVATLRGSGILVATVVNFPAGGDDIEAAVAETRFAVDAGADEVDMVIAWRRVADDAGFVMRQVAALKQAAGGRRLKAILETGALAEPRLVESAARAAIEGGADFVKTSTGKVAAGATPQAVSIMARAIAASGRPVGLKPSGGMRTLADASAMLEAAEAELGAGWATPRTFRLGASSLLDDLLAHATGTEHRGSGEGY